MTPALFHRSSRRHRNQQTAFCKEARGDCKEALALYASIISDSALSSGASNVIFRTSVILAYVGRFDEVRKRKTRTTRRSLASGEDNDCSTFEVLIHRGEALMRCIVLHFAREEKRAIHRENKTMC